MKFRTGQSKVIFFFFVNSYLFAVYLESSHRNIRRQKILFFLDILINAVEEAEGSHTCLIPESFSFVFFRFISTVHCSANN